MNPAELYESSDGIGVATAAPAAAPTHSAATAASRKCGTNLAMSLLMVTSGGCAPESVWHDSFAGLNLT
jgi:hypothetical protein